MANASINPNFPNILLVTGSDIVENSDDFRDRLRNALYGGISPLVRQGSHDYWITYSIPNANMGPNHSREDMSVNPRPQRGIVYMNFPQDDSDNSMNDQISTLLQEVGHQWLVPDDLKFHDSSGREISILGLRDLIDRQNNDKPWILPPLIGRQNKHWSTYFLADASPFDGMNWTNDGSNGGAIRWTQTQPFFQWNITQTNIPVVVNGIVKNESPSRTISIITRYNDLDLIVMGALRVQEAYLNRHNQIQWLDPFLCSNTNYHAGITIAFSRFDQIYFGFFRDHRVLGIQRTGQDLRPLINLGDSRNLFERTALRVRKQGNQLFFEVSAPEIRDLIDTSSIGISPDLLRSNVFSTIDTLSINESPVGAGLILKTWSPLLVEADYSEITLSDRVGRRSFPLDRDPPEFSRDELYQNALSSTELRRYDMPGPFLLDRASFVRTHPHDHLIQLGTRYCVNPIIGDPIGLDNADNWTNVDRAPKALVSVQPGNFTFGVRMRIRRCIFSPWTAGDATGCKMWGFMGNMPCNGIIIPDHIQQKWRGDSNLRFIFIIVARQSTDITNEHLLRIDDVRRFWNNAFNVSTHGRWRSSSNLWPILAVPTH